MRQDEEQDSAAEPHEGENHGNKHADAGASPDESASDLGAGEVESASARPVKTKPLKQRPKHKANTAPPVPYYANADGPNRQALAKHADEYYDDLEGDGNTGQEWYGDVGRHRAYWRVPQPTEGKCMSEVLPMGVCVCVRARMSC